MGFVTEAKCVLCDLGAEFLCIIYSVSVPCLSLLVSGFSPQLSRFEPWPVNVESLVRKMALGLVFSEYIDFLQSISSKSAATLNSRSNGRSLGAFQQSDFLSHIGEYQELKVRTFVFFV